MYIQLSLCVQAFTSAVLRVLPFLLGHTQLVILQMGLYNNSKINMQQRIIQFQHTWYFAFGDSSKSSLIAQFCRENEFIHLAGPSKQDFNAYLKRDVIAEASTELLLQLEPLKKEIVTLFVGSQFSEKQIKIRQEYQQLGRAISIPGPSISYSTFRKAIYPNIIIVYGPDSMQNFFLCANYFSFIDYKFIEKPLCANELLARYDKSMNYIINGLVAEEQELKILEEYFHLRVIHICHNKSELPGAQDFFRGEAAILPVLKAKPYYISVDGTLPMHKLEQAVGEQICPKLIYVNAIQIQAKKYLRDYVKDSNALHLSIFQIQAVLKRKPYQLKSDVLEKIHILTSIIYRDLSRKQVLISVFPWQTGQFLEFERRTRPISRFVDLVDLKHYTYSNGYTSPIYYLQQQLRIKPTQDLKLAKQLAQSSPYWIVNGPAAVGKSSVAKYVASEYSFRLIDYQPYLIGIKQKLITPQDGEELPLAKIIQHFKQLICGSDITYILDGFSITQPAKLAQWVGQIGAPSVLNLKADESQLIRRSRKKNQSDLNAQVSEDESGKVKQSVGKNGDWVELLSQLCPQSAIYQVDYSQSALLSEKLIDSILKPRIYLIQSNSTLVYQNIAIKHDLCFINLRINSLKGESQHIIKKNRKRDVVLCYYNSAYDSTKLISEDLYWIEKHLGAIRYLGIWEEENHSSQAELMKLERPAKQAKKKATRVNESGEEEPVEQQPETAEAEDGEPKKKAIDIYQYQWSMPGSSKNLSQWYFKLKKNIIQRRNTGKQAFAKFNEVLEKLNQDRNANIYQVIENSEAASSKN